MKNLDENNKKTYLESKENIENDGLEESFKFTKNNTEIEDINWDKAKQLCQFLCTYKEIICSLNVSIEVLNKKCLKEFNYEWNEFYALHSATSLIAIRRSQLKLALDKDHPDPAMLIYLGKIALNQVCNKSSKTTVLQYALTMDDLIKYIDSEVR